jgi:MFS transporter, DHA1 family, tetracycline resistance protein
MTELASPPSDTPAQKQQPAPSAPEPAGRKAAFAFIFVTVALDMLALGVIIPVLPKLILGFEGGDTEAAAKWVGTFGTLWAGMQFVAMPILGALSDRVGRRPVILISNFGLAADYVVMALAPSLGWLLVGRIVSGVTSASVTTAFAYVADVTPPEKRAASFGMLGAAFGLGFVIGPALGGYLGGIDPRLPFWVACVLGTLNGCYGLFVLPESLPKEKRSPFNWKRANPIGGLQMLKSQPQLLGLASVKFMNDLAHVVYPSTFALYAMYRFKWGPQEVGLMLGLVGLAGVVVQGALVGRIVRALGEGKALMLGLVCGAAGFAIYGLAPTVPVLLLGVPVAAMWGLAGPAGQALMSKRVSPTEQGRLQGSLSSLTGVAGLIGPVIFTSVFAWFISSSAPLHLPGAAFLAAALFVFLALPLAMRALAKAETSS